MKTIPLHQPFKLHITLHKMPVPVYRVVLVPEDINMLQLHFVIQYAMGWTNSHLFQFQNNQNWMEPADLTVAIPNPYDFDGLWEEGDHREADKVTLKSIFYEERKGEPFWYWYDMGDSWWHEIRFLEATEEDTSNFKGLPVCIEGSGACPPEDCGGTRGYKNFLEAVLNTKHPEYAEMREWAGLSLKEKLDHNFADIDAINEVLASLPDMDEWNLTAKNYFNE